MISIHPSLQSIRIPTQAKVILISAGLGFALLGLLSRFWSRRPRNTRDRDKYQQQRKNAQPMPLWRNTNNIEPAIRHYSNASPSNSFRAHLRQGSVSSDRQSVSTLTALTPDGGIPASELTPQQLGAMGIEALETAIGYWEDALTAYNPTTGQNHLAIADVEEVKFQHQLEKILDEGYQLQMACNKLFLYESSVLFRGSTITSYSSADSFVSAAGEIADLSEFEEYPPSLEDLPLYQAALKKLEEGAIPYRGCRCTGPSSGHKHKGTMEQMKRTNVPLCLCPEEGPVSLKRRPDRVAEVPFRRRLRGKSSLCSNGLPGIPFIVAFNGNIVPPYLVGLFANVYATAQVVCRREGIFFSNQYLLEKEDTSTWFINVGGQLLTDILLFADKDPKDCQAAYDEIVDFVRERANWPIMEEELLLRGVKCLSLYDVVLDYILMDAFDDLENPPSSVKAVVQNRWLSNGFKESALATAVWSVLQAKKRRIKHANGFFKHFYSISEHLTPVLAWGFLGSNEKLNGMCIFFKEEVQGFMRDIFNEGSVRYTTVEHLAEDILIAARERFERTCQRMAI